MSVVTWALLGAAVFGLAALTLQLFLTLRHALRARRVTLSRASAPGISILKPLCGVDDDLRANLENFAQIDYPEGKLEILLGVEKLEDPAHAVALEIVQRHPDRFRLVPQQGYPGHNPKVNQLVTLERAATHDLIVVSDSNTRVERQYAWEIASAFENPDVGCVTHPIVGVGEQRLGSLLDNFHLGSSIGGGMIGSQLAPGKTIVVGKSMALRRAELAALGGFAATSNVLAEDYVIGGLVQNRLKKRVHIAASSVQNISQQKRVRDFFQRYRRWSVIHRTAISLPVYLSQGLLNPAPFGVIALLLAPSLELAAAAAGVVLAKGLIDVGHFALLRPARLSFGEFLKLLAVTPLKDALLFSAWMNGFVERTVKWRGKKLRVTSGSRLVGAPTIPEPVVLPVTPATSISVEAERAPNRLSA